MALLGTVHMSVAAQPVLQPFEATVGVERKKLLLRHRGARYSVDLSNVNDAYEFDEAKLLFASATGGYRYLLVYVGGPSRPTAAADKYCGAGREGALVWLTLDRHWRQLRSQTALIESCFESAEGYYEVKNAQATARWVNFQRMKDFSMSYNAAQPAAGMSIVEQPLDTQ